MTYFTYKKFGLNIGQIYNLNKEIPQNSVIVLMHGVSDCSLTEIKNNQKSILYNEQASIINDLTMDKDVLWKSIKKVVRYEINRSINEGDSLLMIDSINDTNTELIINDFESTYNSMFKSKQMKLRFNKSFVLSGIKNHSLVISVGLVLNEAVVFHLYAKDNEQSTLVYSTSKIKNSEKADSSQIGRLNKRLHWEDMIFFKNNNVKNYDWGGLSSVDLPNGIDKFKMSFGGSIVSYYNLIIGNRLLGKIIVNIMKMVKKI